MDIKQFNNALCNYNTTLTQINEYDFSYTICIKNATEVFFKELKKIDSKLIHYFLENLDRENIQANKKQTEALKFFLMLTIQNYKQPIDFISTMFPEYVEIKNLKSDGWIIRIFQFFISFFLKPKLTFLNLPDTEKIKNAVKRIQQCLNKEKNKEFYDALDTIVDKFLKKDNVILTDYLPLDEDKLYEQWNDYKKKPCYRFKEFKVDGHYHLDTDILLDYLSKRISFFPDSKEKKFLSFSFAALRDYAYKVDISSFKAKAYETKNYLKRNAHGLYEGEVNGIINVIEKIMQRMQLLNKDVFSVNFHCKNDDLAEEMDYLKFCYEQYRAHWEKSYRNGENTANYYELFNTLDNLLYDVIFILDRHELAKNLRFNDIAIILQGKENTSENSMGSIELVKSKKMLIENLELKLTKLRRYTTQLRNFTKTVVLNSLANDMFKLNEHIEDVIEMLNEEINEVTMASPSLEFEFEQSEAFEFSKADKKEIRDLNASTYRFFGEVGKKDSLPENHSNRINASL